MIQSFIILFREILEIAIILSIILVATRSVAGSRKWVAFGIAGGLVGAGIVAIFASNIANALNGIGQEVFNAIVLFIAVLMIGWTVIWMQQHGKEIAQKMKQVGKSVSEGETPLYSVAVVVSLAMWREGAEIVLFMTGILSTAQESIFEIIAGGVAGAASAGLIGFLLYFGLIKLSPKHLFSITSWLLILLASGMTAQAVGYLNAADILPSYGELWNSGWLLSQDSILGKILHAMLGYSERPSVMQILTYISTIAVIFSLKNFNTKKVKI